MHIALVPAEPLFDREHLTLVWISKWDPYGPKNLDELGSAREQLELAEIVVTLVNRSIRMDGPIVAEVQTDNAIMGNKRVSLVTLPPIMYTFRKLCEQLHLNGSQFPDWRPHISWHHLPIVPRVRDKGEQVLLTRAELR